MSFGETSRTTCRARTIVPASTCSRTQHPHPSSLFISCCLLSIHSIVFHPKGLLSSLISPVFSQFISCCLQVYHTAVIFTFQPLPRFSSPAPSHQFSSVRITPNSQPPAAARTPPPAAQLISRFKRKSSASSSITLAPRFHPCSHRSPPNRRQLLFLRNRTTQLPTASGSQCCMTNADTRRCSIWHMTGCMEKEERERRLEEGTAG